MKRIFPFFFLIFLTRDEFFSGRYSDRNFALEAISKELLSTVWLKFSGTTEPVWRHGVYKLVHKLLIQLNMRNNIERYSS